MHSCGFPPEGPDAGLGSAAFYGSAPHPVLVQYRANHRHASARAYASKASNASPRVTLGGEAVNAGERSSGHVGVKSRDHTDRSSRYFFA
ncbi:hypothetical protein HPB50_011707 [Hyalomma asiaticum]|uniref:Uncharacterized protein n=1 Tax=Hyalomma asiaticum TaxID=266040 RepID=A0ACB7SEK5_HYAAI|nr:hypothetical protein HPB50_011707 [Hyalomma asiaticum]